METMVKIQNLSKLFGVFTAVDNISFEVKRGEVLGFLGPNGAGKSTTMKMITGFLSPSGGQITVGGADIGNNPLAVKRQIGYLPEGAPAYPDMTAKQFLDFIAEIRGFHGEHKKQRVNKIIEQVNLHSVANQTIDTLSKGYKRRVGLAQAILHDPDVLILDEPTDGLDPNQKYEVRQLIRDMAKEKVIILSTHILEEVQAVCSRAIIIANGKIVVDGTPAELEAQSKYHNAVTLTLNAKTEQAEKVRENLLKINDIACWETLIENDDILQYRLFPQNNCSIIKDISQCSRDQQWNVLEMHVERGRLDEVFHKITQII